MSEPFIAEIRIFAGNFAPRGWALCNGQLLPIAQNTALFSLIGTIYGGDGRNTTALPDLEGRAPMHPGRGPGLTDRRLGERGGSEETTLMAANMPQHSHSLRATDAPASTHAPGDDAASASTLARSLGGSAYIDSSPDASLNESMLGPAGNPNGADAHNNMQPYLTLNFIIALTGLYPSRG